MVLGLLSDSELREALLRAAAPDEDVLFGTTLAFSALRHGFPRVVVLDAEHVDSARRLVIGRGVGVLTLTPQRLTEWERDQQREHPVFRGEGHLSRRLRPLLRERAAPSWVDVALRDLSRTTGHPLPHPLRGFARRVMEFPPHYHDLQAFGQLTGLSRGALKARFRRRGLASPSVYLRWFRAMAAAHVLRSGSATMIEASSRLGYTSDGNFCRAIINTTGLTPSEVRSQHGWHRLIVRFSESYMGPEALEAWALFEDLFVRSRVA